MANWGNITLEVIGNRRDVLAFAKAARRNREYFTPEMRRGEGGDLSSSRVQRSGATWKKGYHFQTAHDDERAHFRRFSRLHPRCWFALAYSDPNADMTGGHLIRNGRCRSFKMADYARLKYRLRAGYNEGSYTDDNEVLFWEAEWRMLEACIEHARTGMASWSKSRWTPNDLVFGRLEFPLFPDGRRSVKVESTGALSLPRTRPSFEAWRGRAPRGPYSGKPVVNVDGRPAFVELAIVALLNAAGWKSAWFDTYRRQFVRGSCASLHRVQLPRGPERLLEDINTKAGSRDGAFDVVAWCGDEILFLHAMRKGKDRVRSTQRRWLDAALRAGVTQAQLFVVEWEFAPAEVHR
jgi:hypothetical protein